MPHPRLELLPQGQFAAEEFLQTLDAFYYRTGSHVETFGRVVFEAMACGLPVVCHSQGGYADHIRHGENGFLFETTQQAARILADLKADPGLRATVGREARRTVEQLFSPQALRQRLDFLSALEAPRRPALSGHSRRNTVPNLFGIDLDIALKVACERPVGRTVSAANRLSRASYR